MKIRIDTQQVRETGHKLCSAGEQLAEMRDDLERAISSLNTWAWAGRSRVNTEPLLDQVRSQSIALADDMTYLGQLLRQVAYKFEDEDGTAARNLEGMPWIEFETNKEGQFYANETTPTAGSRSGVVDSRPPWKRFLGDYTPLAFIPGFTPPAGGDAITVDDRIDAKFGRDVNLVDGNKVWDESEIAAVDRAVANFPDSLAVCSQVRNFYRDSELTGQPNALGAWFPPRYSGNKGYERASISLYDLGVMPPRQGGWEQRAETVIFHELVHSSQYDADGTLNDVTQAYLAEFEWSFDGKNWSYSGSPDDFPGSSDKYLGVETGYPSSGRNGLEDMAEAVTYYRYEPQRLKQESPERYEWVKENIYNGEEF